ncbi:MAG: AMMECR1 domain-containing protein [Sulfurimonas sp.]|nr:MAG: AMMECR1 domain-containing protein [Sulfurimonas sp.]
MKSRSVLLQLARDSIQEVLEANRTINKNKLLNQHPLLNEKISTTVNIYLKKELRGSSKSDASSLSLLESIIENAKKSAFEDKNFDPLTTSEYLNCEIELLLYSPDGIISEKDSAIIKVEANLAKVFSQ